MNSKPKKRFFLRHKKSSALMVSVAIHALFLIVALSFVAVSVIIKPEQSFEVAEVKRPKMKRRKLQVPVKQKKTQAPKLRQNIIAKPKLKAVTIQMPEIIGVVGGVGGGRGEGLGGLGFGFDMDLFGGSKGTGNEFIGTLYDLKQTSDGELSELGEMVASTNKYSREECYKIVGAFVNSGWNEGRLKKYFKAPKLKYSTFFMMPNMEAAEAPKAYGVEDQVKPSYWICLYKGQIAAPETGRYRFVGFGDDVLSVRLGRKLVIDACWFEAEGKLSNWHSDDEHNRKYPVEKRFNDEKSHSMMVIGDWFQLKKGQAVDIEILIGEIPGGLFSCRLLIEQEGKQYRMAPYYGGTRPVLPIFKTAPIDEKLIGQIHLDPDVATLEGPIFSALGQESATPRN